ncbi:unnamed protein product [Dovyalis caffra]|uniref:Uncharacterized protein n=1 Tax=Dovyalis caffra TaxID=77055 RepID=A0AAV1S4Y1_9ROSI|nr:unnamed protein product [Dovyalis caffra]
MEEAIVAMVVMIGGSTDKGEEGNGATIVDDGKGKKTELRLKLAIDNVEEMANTGSRVENSGLIDFFGLLELMVSSPKERTTK